MSQTLVIRGGTLIDVSGGKSLQNSVIVIEGDRFHQIGQGQMVSVPPGAEVIEAPGKWIIPGLIDSHVHYRDWMPELFLAFGVTSVKDLGNPTEWILAQREGVTRGKIVGPRIFASGSLLIARGARSHHIPVSSPEEARRETKKLIECGVDVIKVHLGVTADMIRAVAEEAHRAGLRVTGHIDLSARDAVLAGLDGVEHATGIDRATIRDPLRVQKLAQFSTLIEKFIGPGHLMEPRYFDELIQIFVERGTYVGPNLITLWGAVVEHRRQHEYEDFHLLRQPGLDYIPEDRRRYWLDNYNAVYGATAKYSFEDLRQGFIQHRDFIGQLARAGGKVVAESDTGAVVPGIGLHRELELLVEAGMTPMQALQSATTVAAEFLQKEKDLGSIAPGKLADLVVLGLNPLESISNTQKIDRVIQGGRVLDHGFHREFTNPIPRPSHEEFYGNPLPQIEKLSPVIATEEDPETEITLRGTSFQRESVARLDGVGLHTEFLSPTELRAIIPARLLRRVGTFPVTVTNPKPEG
ncbi:MAG: amidohydrolase family protein, partial [Candidatus Tectomicrobia bacterium]|nr:amidohydrolase family protein [Candidatus Tectomicrobia bacterium]